MKRTNFRMSDRVLQSSLTAKSVFTVDAEAMQERSGK